MTGAGQIIHEANLTQLEMLAIDSELNAADGHARQSLTASQVSIVDALPQLFHAASQMPFAVLEDRAHRALFEALHQHTAPVGSGQIMNAYASSVAMDVVARCLSELGGAVGLLHPTFDNIPDLLRSRGLQLVPIEEGELAAGEPYNCLETVAHVFITTPNNPTGAVLEEPALQRLAEQCAERGVTLILDTSFRGFDPRAWYDHYAVLNRAGVDFVVIEDTGKLWPMLELKLGVLVASDRLTNRLCGALSDVLLSVSPLVLALVERLALDFVAGGHNQLHALIARNRSSLGASLARRASGARLADPEARVSVARVELPLGVTAEELCRDLRSARVHLLPGDCFFWARPHDGDRFVRVALARDPDVVDAVAEALSQNLQRL